MSIARTRSVLYRLARLLGDLQAIRRRRIAKRIGWRLSGRLTSHALGRLWR